ncbi:DUF4097 family beta strand repeat protein [Parapedobacter sp. ISTM3]|uniref:DUF4097 family beta strand repeat-containing protein n=1 Tax=Parapedobacter sp. ISTM3 TaxID=2800130 RepID=UPI0019070FA1|nr:DUF4097 family beta strand repeat-containing protein [Parapedobacter sp. ISTM3]MBK1442203.1 DUF4097 family beta strand repeat protein [Parapedobacter sp. ISTM3]
MKKQTIILAIFLSLCCSAWAQKTYKIGKPAGKLYLNLNSAFVEGYDGNEIVFSGMETSDEEEDNRAKGLQVISPSGYRDNTGLGINVSQEGSDIHVNIVGNHGIEKESLTVRVPKEVAIVFSYGNTFFADSVVIKNIKGEIELSATYNNILLENNSGPMNIKTVHGNIDASFVNDIKGPVSIISVYGHVDVALPATTKANVTLGTAYGKLYAADDFNIAITPKNNNDEDKQDGSRSIAAVTSGSGAITLSPARVVNVSQPPMPPAAPEAISATGFVYRSGQQQNVEGTINGGGIDIILKSTYKNIYLRTK